MPPRFKIDFVLPWTTGIAKRMIASGRKFAYDPKNKGYVFRRGERVFELLRSDEEIASVTDVIFIFISGGQYILFELASLVQYNKKATGLVEYDQEKAIFPYVANSTAIPNIDETQYLIIVGNHGRTGGGGGTWGWGVLENDTRWTPNRAFLNGFPCWYDPVADDFEISPSLSDGLLTCMARNGYLSPDSDYYTNLRLSKTGASAGDIWGILNEVDAIRTSLTSISVDDGYQVVAHNKALVKKNTAGPVMESWTEGAIGHQVYYCTGYNWYLGDLLVASAGAITTAISFELDGLGGFKWERWESIVPGNVQFVDFCSTNDSSAFVGLYYQVGAHGVGIWDQYPFSAVCSLDYSRNLAFHRINYASCALAWSNELAAQAQGYPIAWPSSWISDNGTSFFICYKTKGMSKTKHFNICAFSNTGKYSHRSCPTFSTPLYSTAARSGTIAVKVSLYTGEDYLTYTYCLYDYIGPTADPWVYLDYYKDPTRWQFSKRIVGTITNDAQATRREIELTDAQYENEAAIGILRNV